MDTRKVTISVTPEKRKKKSSMCNQWGNKKYVTKNHLQSLLGLLLHVIKCVKNSRAFLNRMLHFIGIFPGFRSSFPTLMGFVCITILLLLESSRLMPPCKVLVVGGVTVCINSLCSWKC